MIMIIITAPVFVVFITLIAVLTITAMFTPTTTIMTPTMLAAQFM